MYIDFEDHRPETPRVEGLSVREGVLVSIILHLLLFIAIMFMPDLSSGRADSPLARQMAQRMDQQSPRFVFMQPRVDISKPQPKPNVDASDQDRVASSVERAPDPKNSLPFARGNTPERVEAEPSKPGDRADHSEDAAAPGRQNQPSEGQLAANDPARTLRLPDAASAAAPAWSIGGRQGSNGVLGEAIRNLQRYTQQQSFDNPQGSGDGQGLIQFDSKGVEFGPWLRRFVAQVKRNWFIPTAAMMMKGHVVVTFNVHKDGAITDIEVKAPSSIDAFDRAAVNALIGSNPTQPLPPEYPADKAFFTVTFLYNEMPPGQYGQ
jgi:TonB family protein